MSNSKKIFGQAMIAGAIALAFVFVIAFASGKANAAEVCQPHTDVDGGIVICVDGHPYHVLPKLENLSQLAYDDVKELSSYIADVPLIERNACENAAGIAVKTYETIDMLTATVNEDVMGLFLVNLKSCETEKELSKNAAKGILRHSEMMEYMGVMRANLSFYDRRHAAGRKD